MVIDGVGFDSNILIYAIDVKSDLYIQARNFIEKLLSAGKLVFVTPQNFNEVCSVLTSPTRSKHPISLMLVFKLFDELLASFNLVFPEMSSFALHRHLSLKYDISGSRLYDNFLIATFLSHNIKTFYTNNPKDFLYYKEATIINPFTASL